jgi:anaerobic magnesium-protoporphyrin IX monomethyl ester cyclase
MKVLLIYPRLHYPGYGELQEPLGLLYIAASLEQSGFDVDLVDLTLAESHAVLDEPLRYADVVGFGCSTALFGRALAALEYVRKLRPDVPVIIGGPHATALPEDVMQKGFDYGVIGEGEGTVVDLLTRMAKGKKPHGTPGIISRREGELVRGPARPFIKDLDSLPHPARHLVDYPFYFANGMLHIGMFISRGCPFQCAFCKPMQDMLFGKKIRILSPENVAREMRGAVDLIGEHLFLFRDDTMAALGTEWFERFSQARRQQAIQHLCWSCQARVDQITPEMLSLMKGCGCVGIAFGVESGSQKILDYYRKRFKVEDTVKAFELCHEFKIGTHAFIMMGAPDETREDLKMTVELIKRIQPESVSVSITTPAPGSDLFREAQERGILTYESYEDADYLLNREPMRLEFLTREDLLEAHDEILNLVPHTLHIQHFQDQHRRWQTEQAKPRHVRG